MRINVSIYGLKKLNGDWLVDGNGNVFHTPFREVAKAQQEYLKGYVETEVVLVCDDSFLVSQKKIMQSRPVIGIYKKKEEG